MSRTPTSNHTRAIWLGLLLVLFVAAGLRLWQINSLPPGFHYDESFEGLEAWRILVDPSYRPIFLTGNFGVPPLNVYANAAMFRLFAFLGAEAGPTAMRTTVALFGVAGVLSVFALADELRRLDGRLSHAFPIWAAAALAVMRWHVHFSRMGIEPVIVPLIWAMSTWLLLRGWRTGSWLSFAGAGVFLAAGMYAYQAAWVIPFLMIVVGVILAVQCFRTENRRPNISGQPSHTGLQSFRIRLLGLTVTAVSAFVLFLPLGLFFLNHIDLVFLRPTQLAVVGATGSPADTSVWRSMLATLGMFWPIGNTGDLDPRRNLPGAPALDPWLALPFFLGLGLTFWRSRYTAYAIMLVGWFGLLLPGMFSEYAPHFHRVLGAATPTALLVGVGLDTVWQWPPLRRRHLQWATVLLLVAGLLTTGRDYFVRWAALPDLYYAFDTGLWDIGNWISGQETGNTVYISPRGLDHTTLAFAMRPQLVDHPTTAPAPVFSYDGRYIFPLTAAVIDRAEHYVAIEHEDFRTPLLLPDLFPDAKIEQKFVDGQGATYAAVYTRPSGAEPQRLPRIELARALGDGISLAGYDVLPERPVPDGVLYLQLHWLVDQQPVHNWTIFTHLVDPATGDVVAGKDALPGNGSLPTTHWQPGWRVLDEYQIALPADLHAGEYGLRIGLYDQDGRRLPADDTGINIGAVRIE